MKNRVAVKIMDTTYYILADESEDYIEKIAKVVDKKIKEIMDLNEKTSITMAAVLTAFNLCDEVQKTQDTAENLREQLRSYLEDVGRHKQEADDARREIMRLQNEIAHLKMQLTKTNAE
ncbi:MAG: cell division protein ZapA [Bacillota bacterium]|nr:cell division protein ZapA [Bacillota bacterium]